MIQYERIDISEKLDFNKENNSKECTISHYWYFDAGLEHQPYVCNRCHDFSMSARFK